MSEKLSVAIITKNEEANIEKLLNSILWVDEIVICDTGSTDRTIEICKKYNCKIFSINWEGFGKAKQSAVDKTSYNWVLSLDADEYVTEELKDDIRAIESRIGMRLTMACTSDGPLRIIATDAVVIGLHDFCLGFYSHAPGIRQRFSLFHQQDFIKIFPSPTLVLTHQLLKVKDPFVRQEYIYHETSCYERGHYESIIDAQRIFNENYKEGDYEVVDGGVKVKKGYPAELFKGRLGQKIKNVILTEMVSDKDRYFIRWTERNLLPIEIVFWDFDETIIDNMPFTRAVDFKFISFLLEQYGKDAKPDIRDRIFKAANRSLEYRLGLEFEAQMKDVSQMFKHYGIDVGLNTKQMIGVIKLLRRLHWESDDWRIPRIHKGAIDTIDDFHQGGLIQFVISGGEPDRVENQIDLLGLRKYFKEIHAQVDVDKTRIIQSLIEKYSLDRRRCTFIGDLPSDVLYAHLAGIYAIGFVPTRTLALGNLDETEIFKTVVKADAVILDNYRDAHAYLVDWMRLERKQEKKASNLLLGAGAIIPGVDVITLAAVIITLIILILAMLSSTPKPALNYTMRVWEWFMGSRGKTTLPVALIGLAPVSILGVLFLLSFGCAPALGMVWESSSLDEWRELLFVPVKGHSEHFIITAYGLVENDYIVQPLWRCQREEFDGL